MTRRLGKSVYFRGTVEGAQIWENSRQNKRNVHAFPNDNSNTTG